MADESLGFTFDTASFERGFAKIQKGMQGIQNGAKSVAKGVSRGIKSAAMKIGSLFVALKGVKGLLNTMPEIGKAFGIAKDVFLKNLLFPLRQEIMPLLQKMLDWVRDNRTTFVRWGRVVANVFKSIVTGAKAVIKIGKALFLGLGKLIGRIFGESVNSFEEFMNVLSFKFAVVVTFISGLIGKITDIFGGLSVYIEPIIENILSIAGRIGELLSNLFSPNKEGNSFLTVIKTLAETFAVVFEFVTGIVDSFLTGFIPAVKELATPLQGIVDKIKEIFENIFAGERGEKLKAFFETLGHLFGTVLVEAFKAIETIIGWMEPIIYGLIDALLGITEFIFPSIKEKREEREGMREVRAAFTPEEAKALLNQIDDGKTSVSPELENALRVIAVEDALITKDGQVIKFAPDDNIMAFKGNPPTGGGGVILNIDSINLNVTEGDAKASGQNFIEGMVEGLESQYNTEFERRGA